MINESNLTIILCSFLAALLFALVNLFSYKISTFIGKHKGAVLSLFGGITATYVFLDLLPSLQISSQYLTLIGNSFAEIYEDAIFLVAFVGFLVYFTLEHFAVSFRDKKAKMEKESKASQTEKGIFAVHLLTFVFLGFVLSFVLLFEYQSGIVAGLLYTVAVSLHLFIFDNSMVEHYKNLQIRIGRYIAGFVPLIGWVTSVLFPERIAEAYILLAFISGAILYISIHNEIPLVKREKNFMLFLIGAFFYGLILLGQMLIHF